jgi:hypothetical protein
MEQTNDGNSYFHRLSSMDEFERSEVAGYYTDDEIENLWAHSLDDESGELIFGEE